MNLFDLPKGTIEDESVLRGSYLEEVRQIWHKKGDRGIWHRIRGPAVIRKNGEEEWYRYDELYTPTAHEKMLWELRKKNESV